MSYTHLTISEHSKIEAYLELDYSIRQIARFLKRNSSIISRKLQRHPTCSPEEAQTRYQANKSKCGAKSKLTLKLKKLFKKN